MDLLMVGCLVIIAVGLLSITVYYIWGVCTDNSRLETIILLKNNLYFFYVFDVVLLTRSYIFSIIYKSEYWTIS